jgi:hypothetical protein
VALLVWLVSRWQQGCRLCLDRLVADPPPPECTTAGIVARSSVQLGSLTSSMRSRGAAA